jgi:hydroxyacylglutathione hydrolase
MELTDKIHIFQIDFDIEIGPDRKIPRFVNVLLVIGKKITLIDTGVKSSAQKIFTYISNCGRNYKEIDSIILSHAHPDHIGSAAEITELTHCKVAAYEDDVPWIENIQLQNKMRPVPGFLKLVDRPVIVDRKLKDKQVMKADENITMEIIHSPGHSRGSISIFFKEDKILFTADAIPLKNDIPNYDSYPDLMNSLLRIKNNKDFSMLLTSWTPPLNTLPDIENLIGEGEQYMRRIDEVVKSSYAGDDEEPLSRCKTAVEKLGLPPYLVNPIVDKAFRSHLK